MQRTVGSMYNVHTTNYVEVFRPTLQGSFPSVSTYPPGPAWLFTKYKAFVWDLIELLCIPLFDLWAQIRIRCTCKNTVYNCTHYFSWVVNSHWGGLLQTTKLLSLALTNYVKALKASKNLVVQRCYPPDSHDISNIFVMHCSVKQDIFRPGFRVELISSPSASDFLLHRTHFAGLIWWLISLIDRWPKIKVELTSKYRMHDKYIR